MGAKIALAQLFSFIFLKMNEAGFMRGGGCSALFLTPETKHPARLLGARGALDFINDF
jgi:hypothetical protein